MKDMKILVFGNPLVEADRLALDLIPDLKREFPGMEFIETDSTEEFYNHGRNLKILDVSPGIEKVEIIRFKSEKDLEILNISKIFSMHDFDLGYNLRLMKQMNKIDSAHIICLPMGKTEEDVLEDTIEAIEAILHPN